MLCPESRIRSAAQFQQVFIKRQRLFGSHCLLYHRCNALNRPRLGVIVSKRNVRTAVARNRFKRLAREVFRAQQQNLPAVDVVIIARSSAYRADKPELQRCLKQLLQQLITQSASL